MFHVEHSLCAFLFFCCSLRLCVSARDLTGKCSTWNIRGSTHFATFAALPNPIIVAKAIERRRLAFLVASNTGSE